MKYFKALWCFVVLQAFLCSGLAWGASRISLPWETTFDCDEWIHTTRNYEPCKNNPGCGCEDIGRSLDNHTSEGHATQITTPANYPGGGGGRGMRMWVGDVHEDNSGGLLVTFDEPKTELWFRWYMRYQKGFSWNPLEYDKWFYPKSRSASTNVVLQFKYNELNIHSNTSQTHMSRGNKGWTYVMGGPTGDGKWHCYEAHIKRDGKRGIGRIWVDNELLLEYTDIDYGSGEGWNRMSIGSNKEGCANGRDYYIDFDDIAIAENKRIYPIGRAPDGDTTAPTVSVTSPTAEQRVSGTVALSASALDNVRVAGVQFQIDGVNYKAEDTAVPYSVSLDSTAISNGTHFIVAVARDTSGNLGTSSSIPVEIFNAEQPPVEEGQVIVYEDWERWTTGTGRGNTLWDCDGTNWDDDVITTNGFEGSKALQMNSSDYGRWRIGVGDHPQCNRGGEIITDITIEEDYYLSPGFQWPSVAMKLWIVNCFESWGAGYSTAAGQEKPNSWAPYYMTIALKKEGQLFGELTRAEGLGDSGEIWHSYDQNVGSTVRLEVGKWYRIKFRLKLNEIGRNDGVFQLWLNDELKCSYSNINYRGNYSKYGWNHLMMTLNAVPGHPQNQWVARDNIKVGSGEGCLAPPSSVTGLRVVP